jgi:hypothetical protein
MPIYFFDTRDDETFIRDEIGLEFADVAAAKAEAAASLGELARDVLPSSNRRTLAVEVRNEHRPVLVATLTFEAVLLVA